MARKVCSQCHRPQKVCICDFITAIDNRVEIGVFQHPTEAGQIKGTAIIAELALKKSKRWVGETLDDAPELQQWLKSGDKVFLLYPPTEGQQTKVNSVNDLHNMYQQQMPFKILVLDGTWRKTYKMMQLNPELMVLPRVVLNPQTPSAYKVRKQKNEQSLSTVEAIVELLSEIESDRDKYQPVLAAFEQVQNQQLAFREEPAKPL